MRFRPRFRVSSSLILRTREVFFGMPLFFFFHHTPYTLHHTPLYTRAHAFLNYIIYRCWLSAKACSITYFPKTAQNTPKIPYFVKCVFSIRYKESAKKVHFFCRNIWSIQKKAVPLHSLLRNKCVSIFYRSPDIKIQILEWEPNFFAPNRRKTSLKDWYN